MITSLMSYIRPMPLVRVPREESRWMTTNQEETISYQPHTSSNFKSNDNLKYLVSEQEVIPITVIDQN
ncbi:hypothetical protein THOB06_50143 [Vibrio rotiferianus]|nr:hypothetical protein THOG10_50143 [Vibrio rotiferianus]CAH1591531.1 hypothetical protein THOB06_50143 [Vibrio rotiferianus]